MQKFLSVSIYSIFLSFITIDSFISFLYAQKNFDIKLSSYGIKKNPNNLISNSLINDLNYIDFKQLKKSNKIKKDHSIGKIDPFAKDDEYSVKKELKFLSLLGIVSNGSDHYALIKYKENIGNVILGSIGGESTTLLPKNVKLVEISINESKIIIGFKDEKYILSIY